MSYLIGTSSSSKENRSPFALLTTANNSLYSASTPILENSTADWVSLSSDSITSTGTCFHSAVFCFKGGDPGAGSSVWGFDASASNAHLRGHAFKAGTHSAYSAVLGAWFKGNSSIYGVGTSLTVSSLFFTASGTYAFQSKVGNRCRSLVRRLTA